MAGYTTKIGPYEVEQTLAQGGFGFVVKARGRDGLVAIKIIKDRKRLPPDVQQLIHRLAMRGSQDALAGVDADELRRAEELASEERVAAGRRDREVAMLQELGEKEGFVGLEGVGELPDGRPYFVMPYMPGGTLRDRIERERRLLSIDETVKIGTKIALAMGIAHRKGIVHRDLKPENVLFDGIGNPVIADLGTAKYFMDPGELSKTGQLQGTALYMAPEQIEDAKHVGPPADVYSIGVMLYECLTGTCPFQGNSLHQMLVKAVDGGKHDSIRQLRPETPKWLIETVERCIAHDPAKRYANGEELASALASHQARELRSAEVGGVVSGVWDRRKRRWKLWALLAGCAAVLGAGALLLALLPATHRPLLEPTPVPSPPISMRPTPRPSAEIKAPSWYLGLSDGERPGYPLPAGLRFGNEPETYLNESDGSVLLFVPASTFLMGAEANSFTRPIHEVELSSYFIGRDEVTYAQFARFAKKTGYVTGAEKLAKADAGKKIASDLGLKLDEGMLKDFTWKRPFSEAPGELPQDTHPVVRVSWIDAEEYVHWAGLELPTEAQWERAAAWDPKTKKSRKYPWGDRDPGPGTPKFANLADDNTRFSWKISGYDDGYAHVAPIGSFPDGNASCGARDMCGNASEWCLDAWDPDFYSRSAPIDPCNQDLERGRMQGRVTRVTRGGSWHDGLNTCSAVNRGWAFEDTGYEEHGFRVAFKPARK